MRHALTDGHPVLALALRGKIGTGAEAAPGARYEEHPRLRIPCDLGHGRAHVGDEPRIDAVQHLGPVESEQGNAVFDGERDRFHGRVPVFVLVGGPHRASARFMPPDFGRK